METGAAVCDGEVEGRVIRNIDSGLYPQRCRFIDLGVFFNGTVMTRKGYLNYNDFVWVICSLCLVSDSFEEGIQVRNNRGQNRSKQNKNKTKSKSTKKAKSRTGSRATMPKYSNPKDQQKNTKKPAEASCQEEKIEVTKQNSAKTDEQKLTQETGSNGKDSLTQDKLESVDDSTNSKGFVEQMKGLSDALAVVSVIGTTFVLILSTIKVFIFHLFYQVPIRNLNDISMMSSVLINTIVIGLVGFIIYSHIFLVNRYKDDSFKADVSNIILSPIFIFVTTLIIVFAADAYILKYLADKFLFFEQYKSIIFFVLLALIYLFYCFPWIGISHYYRKGLYLSTEKEEQRKKKEKISEKITRWFSVEGRLKIVFTIAIFATIIVAIAFILTAFFRLSDDIYPCSFHEQEIVYLKNDSQSYTVVCNSSNGKIIEKCDMYSENDRIKIVIYNDEYRFIDSKDADFKQLHFDDINFDNIRYQPVKTTYGTDNVTITFSDKELGSGNYSLKECYCYYLYFQINNNENKEVSIGDTFKLEVHEYGQWRSLPVKLSIDSVESACKVEPKTTEWTFYNIFKYGDLEPGHYRIALSSDANSTSYYYVEFDINEDKEFELCTGCKTT